MGDLPTANCTVNDTIACNGTRTNSYSYICHYCWQLPQSNITCEQPTADVCGKAGTSGQVFKANCYANSNVLCLGNRTFTKKQPCYYTKGKKWNVAMLYSIFLGGFGADRFYLEHWGWAVFKLCSFGGFGIWALVDFVLLAVGYLMPFDGSFYA
ncbi:hypothetical protein AKO1_013136 [Acrasis kona]|uniref:TM2 domain-containing protein n=1 Tax=Acrasis kona TaxID=1008807 RepID=A0AAW2YSJ8_9EUKA